jgi:hypothetical protein
MLAAFITESLSKMRLPGSGRADKSEISVGIDRSQGADMRSAKNRSGKYSKLGRIIEIKT